MSETVQLYKLPFTVVSVKTLNDAQSNAEVVAVSCLRIRDNRIADELQLLINPGLTLPEEFTRRTGLYNSALLNQPALQDALPDIAAFIGRDIIFWTGSPRKTNAVHRHFRLTQPRERQFFLQTLAEKALPDLPRHHLNNLTEHYAIPSAEIQQPEAAARAAAQILLRVLETLQQRHAVSSLIDLLNVCPTVKPFQRRTRNDLAFDRDRLKQYPTQPGVYFMKNRLGEILYIGKAKNLRNRLRSYFQKQSRLPEKIAAMMKQVAMIDTLVVGSELEALLLESRLIKQHQPFFNKKIKDYQRMMFMKVSTPDPFPKISVSHETDDPNAAYFGPFNGKSSLLYKLEILNRVFKLRDCTDRKFAEHRNAPCMQYQLGLCSGPCAGLISEADYQESVVDFMRYLAQQPSNTIDGLIAKRDAYGEALQFEKAALIQEQLDLLERLQLRSYGLTKAIEEHHCLLILPAAEPDTYRLLAVVQGQPFEWLSYHPHAGDEQALLAWLSQVQSHVNTLEINAKKRASVPKAMFEEARLISHWLDHRTDDDGFVIYLKHKPPEQLLNELRLTFTPTQWLNEDLEEDSHWDTDDEQWEWEQANGG
ncbi:MAG: hypothetical protein K0Q50_604 [Vampirovibrio sp.]|jgi:DNA polymerase-3 subunit epsilon|nr:hypothetical protein [Vampirovibrio sp.]